MSALAKTRQVALACPDYSARLTAQSAAGLLSLSLRSGLFCFQVHSRHAGDGSVGWQGHTVPLQSGALQVDSAVSHMSVVAATITSAGQSGGGPAGNKLQE